MITVDELDTEPNRKISRGIQDVQFLLDLLEIHSKLWESLSSSTVSEESKTPLQELRYLIYLMLTNRSFAKSLPYLSTFEQRLHTPIPITLAELLQNFRLSHRDWRIIEARSGFQDRQTLSEIGKTILYGVSRSRAQQLEADIRIRIQETRIKFSAVFVRVDNKSPDIAFTRKSPADQDPKLLRYIHYAIMNAGLSIEETDDVEKFALLMRYMICNEPHAVTSTLPRLSYVASKLQPIIKEHPLIAEDINDQKERGRHLTYIELAIAALEKARKPMHYTEIAGAAELLNPKGFVNVKSIHNALTYRPDIFVLVDQGKYGLKSWGLSAVDTYPKIIANVLKRFGEAMDYETIEQSVNKIRQIKKSSLLLYLTMHPRFYQSQNGSYGLRIWLTSREKQTLRTPLWRVETAKSFERLERVQDRYNIERIISEDLQ